MRVDALDAGKYVYPGKQKEFQRIQILTIEELPEGKKPEYLDYGGRSAIKQAKKRAPSTVPESLLALKN